MRTGMLTIGLCGLLLWFGLFAGASQDDSHKAVRRISLEGLKGQPKGSPFKPTEITSDAGVAKAFPDKSVQERIKKEVDFATERLVYVAWSGSGGDKFSYTVARRSDGPVIFRFQPGLTKDLRPHRYLYAISKKLNWEKPKEAKDKE